MLYQSVKKKGAVGVEKERVKDPVESGGRKRNQREKEREELSVYQQLGKLYQLDHRLCLNCSGAK